MVQTSFQEGKKIVLYKGTRKTGISLLIGFSIRDLVYLEANPFKTCNNYALKLLKAIPTASA